jgi:hypothetical protein
VTQRRAICTNQIHHFPIARTAAHDLKGYTMPPFNSRTPAFAIALAGMAALTACAGVVAQL